MSLRLATLVIAGSWAFPTFAQTYIKPTVAQAGNFGYSSAMSGNTLVVGAPRESSSATGVNGNPNDSSSPGSGAAYVYVWDGASWTLEAYLKPSNTQAGEAFGNSVAISGDTIVVGAPFESSNATGVNGNQNNTLLSKAGAAYVFVRTGNHWTQQAYLKASVARLSANGLVGFLFGQPVAIDGDTIVVGANQENGSATGVNGDPTPTSPTFAGAACVFTRTAGVWSQQAYLKSYSPTKDLFFGQTVAVSGDLVAVGGEDQTNSVGINSPPGTTGGVYNQGEVTVFSRTGSTWTKEAFIKTPVLHAGSQFGGCSLSLEGSRLAVGACFESSDANGVDVGVFGPYRQAGAVYTFTRSAGVWTQEDYVKPEYVAASAIFGWSVALDNNNLLVGSLFESSASSGINGNPADTSLGNSGAAYQFTRSGGAWTQQQYIKAPHPQAGAFFGSSVSVQNDIMAIGAYNEGSNATGIGGNDLDASMPGAGTIFAYTPTAMQSVTVQSVPAGIAFNTSGAGCAPGAYVTPQTLSWQIGSNCTVTMPPTVPGVGSQSVFVQWEDASINPARNITAPAVSTTYTASYKTQYLLSVALNPPAGGSITGSALNAYYDPGTALALTAQPAANYVFAGWTGACSGGGTCPLTINAPTNVIANFNLTLVQFTVVVPIAVQFTFNGTTYTGTQTIAVPPGTYALSSTTPQATAAGTQLAFVSWSDGGAISHSVTLASASMSVTGTFKTQYLLTTSALAVGAGTVVPPTGYYDSGAVVNAGSVANAGFTFVFWSGACTGSASVCPVLMNGPQTIVGNFAVPPTWIQLGPANSPAARYLPSSAFDAGRNELLVFGGFSSPNSSLADTWSWNGTDWTLRTTNGPSARSQSSMAYDPAHEQMLLFGGQVGAAATNETWLWDGAAGVWTKQSLATSPSPRYLAGLAWDGTRLILFGGFDGLNYLNDTWAWTGLSWVPLASATAPPVRLGAAMTYDAVRNQVVLFGGFGGGNYLNDTWVWTGSTWSARSPAASPSPRSSAMLASDPLLQQSVLFGGFKFGVSFPAEVWLWEGANWRSVAENPSPTDRSASAMVYDPARQQIVLLGGADPTADNDTWIFANNAVQQFYTLTTAANPAGAGTIAATSPGQAGPAYRTGSTVTLTPSSTPAAPFAYWSGACAGQGSACSLTMLSNLTAIANYPRPPKWITLGPPKLPTSRYGAAMAFDSARGEVVLFSGGGRENGTYSNETWIWDGTTWSLRSPAVSPTARSLEALAYDPLRQQTVIFGGTANGTLFADTWVWDGTNWSEKFPAHSPSPRSAASLAWDGSQLILFGGFTGAPESAETWAWDGTDWTQLAVAGPPAREGAMMTYDPVRHQVLLFGGAGGEAFLADTWIWDGTIWTKRTPATSPTGRYLAAIAWHDAIQQIVLFSGEEAVFANDTWWWDGINWRLHPEPVSPSLQWGSAAAWDGARQQMVLLSHYAGDTGEMWIYANNAVQQFYTLTTNASPASGGTVSPSGAQSYGAGTLVYVAATKSAGFEFQGWSGACAGSKALCPINVNANMTATANFGYPLSWLQLTPASSAPPKGNLIFQNPISMAFDAARQQVVYFGGPLGDQTWTWNGTTWSKRSPAHSPPPRSGHAMAYDAARQRVILFGGGASSVAVNDTWAWDGTDWTLMDTGTGPGKRFNHAMTYDRARQEIVLFGGLDENFNFYQDTWVWNGAQWIQRFPAASPKARSDFGMAYDPVNAEVVIASGFEGQNDMSSWDGSSWTRKSPAHLPPSTLNHFSQMSYDERLQRIVMLIDNQPAAPLTWVWDGLDWTQLSPAQNPTPRMATGTVYDGVRQQILLFGGDLFGAGLNDTWVLAPPTAILTLQSIATTKNAAGNYIVTFTLKNTGNSVATSVFEFGAAVVTLANGATTAATTFPAGQFSTIAPGATGTFQAQFPASAGSGPHSFATGGGYGLISGATGNWNATVRSVMFP